MADSNDTQSAAINNNTDVSDTVSSPVVGNNQQSESTKHVSDVSGTVANPVGDNNLQQSGRTEHAADAIGVVPSNKPITRSRVDLRSVEENFDFDFKRDEWEHRKAVSKDIISTFIKINAAIIAIVFLFFIVEIAAISKLGDAYKDRVIDSKLMMTLIGATTVQLGAIAVAVSGWLFPKAKNE